MSPFRLPGATDVGGHLDPVGNDPGSLVLLIHSLAPRRVRSPVGGRRDCTTGDGRHRESALLQRALTTHGLDGLARLSSAEIARECGLPSGHAARVASAFALGREVEAARIGRRPSLKRPEAVAELMAPVLRGLQHEAFYALFLDARHRLKGRVLVGQGSLTSAPVHPREVFGPAVRASAAAVIVVHNHPSGDPEPSKADVEVTGRLVQAGGTLGIPLLDHLIWADSAWTSLRDRGAWPS